MEIMKQTADFEKDVVRALRKAGRYSKSLDIQVVALAGALRTLALANHEIDNLESTTVKVKTRYGNDSLAPHPAFKIQKDAQESVTKQMKALGLTAEELSGQDENDPLIDLTKEVRGAGRRRKPDLIIRPDEI